MAPTYAGIAQLVERNLAKVEVASSSLVSRSRYLGRPLSSLFLSPTAGWQSGYAAACKAVYAGSIPTPASIFSQYPAQNARVAELVDARDLKSLGRKVIPVRFRARAP